MKLEEGKAMQALFGSGMGVDVPQSKEVGVSVPKLGKERKNSQ